MSDLVRARLREAVFGTQDGLISTLGALTGIAAGTQDRQAVVIAGFVIIVVGSLSMAAGSYLSSKANRQYLEHLSREERELIVKDPEGERREVRQMYRVRGYKEEEIDMIEKRLFSNPHLLLEDMAHKELGITPQSMEDPAGNAFIMGTAYVAGGLVPVIPYWFTGIPLAMPISIGTAFTALFLMGAVKGRLVRQSWWRSGVEMVAVAGVAALAGFFIGRLASRWVV